MKGSASKTDSLTQNDIDKIAGLLDKTFDSRLAPLTKKEKVERLEKWAVVVGEKIGVKLKI